MVGLRENSKMKDLRNNVFQAQSGQRQTSNDLEHIGEAYSNTAADQQHTEFEDIQDQELAELLEFVKSWPNIAEDRTTTTASDELVLNIPELRAKKNHFRNLLSLPAPPLKVAYTGKSFSSPDNTHSSSNLQTNRFVPIEQALSAAVAKDQDNKAFLLQAVGGSSTNNDEDKSQSEQKKHDLEMTYHLEALTAEPAVSTGTTMPLIEILEVEVVSDGSAVQPLPAPSAHPERGQCSGNVRREVRAGLRDRLLSKRPIADVDPATHKFGRPSKKQKVEVIECPPPITDKKLRRRRQNREAAERFRQKQRNTIETLTDNTMAWQAKNSKLRAEINFLKNYMADLQQLREKHLQACPIVNVQVITPDTEQVMSAHDQVIGSRGAGDKTVEETPIPPTPAATPSPGQVTILAFEVNENTPETEFNFESATFPLTPDSAFGPGPDCPSLPTNHGSDKTPEAEFVDLTEFPLTPERSPRPGSVFVFGFDNPDVSNNFPEAESQGPGCLPRFDQLVDGGDLKSPQTNLADHDPLHLPQIVSPQPVRDPPAYIHEDVRSKVPRIQGADVMLTSDLESVALPDFHLTNDQLATYGFSLGDNFTQYRRAHAE